MWNISGLGGMLHTERSDRFGVVVAALVAVLLLTGGTAQASVGTNPTFTASDGTQNGSNQSGVNCSSVVDWSCPGLPFLATPDPAANDVAFVPSTSTENNPDSWQFGSSSGLDPKADILANWSYSFTDPIFVNNYLALAFYRASGNGNSDVDFELNQNPPGDTYTNSHGTNVICRADGDVLIAFDVQSTAAVKTTAPSVYEWNWSGTPCTSGANGSWTLVGSLPAGTTEGALSPSAITNYLSTGVLGNSFGAGTFGEAAASLTGLANVIKPQGGCEFFNHIQLTTRSSTTFSSSMEDFIDGGQIVAPACENPPPPPPPGCTSPVVEVSSPADNSVEVTSTVTLGGTSTDLAGGRVVVYDGGSPIADPRADHATGDWTVTLANVANGQHTYTVVATTACGRSVAAVHVTVSASGGGNGNGGNGGAGAGFGSVSGANAGGVNGPWFACTSTRTLSVADVYEWAGMARLTGFAPLGSIGKIVTIIAAWNHKAIGKATVLGDNSFRATVPLPPPNFRSNVKQGAYLAQLGDQTSAPLAFARRIYNTRIQIRFVKEKVTTYKYNKVRGQRKLVKVTKYVAADLITFVGTVVGPLTTPRQTVIIRGAPTCAGVAHGPIVERAKVDSRGRFSVTFYLPKSLLRYRVVFLRAQTVGLQTPPVGRKATANRPKRNALYGITRGVHAFGAA
jgi:hypothetical protein